MKLTDWLTILIPAGVTIVGLFVNYFATKSSIKNETKKQQRSIKLERLLLCLENYQKAYRAIMTSSKLPEKEKERIIDEQALAFQEIMDYVYLYGSEEACKITSTWQQYNYLENQTSSNNITPVCYANLLSSQICLDVTGTCNKPSYYYKMKLTDYNKTKDIIKETHNKIVKDLKLDDRLKF